MGCERLLAAVWMVGAIGCSSSPQQQAPVADAASYEVCSASRVTLPLIETGSGGNLTAAVAEVTPNPPSKHQNVWMLAVKDANGAPVDDAEIAFIETYMPVHDHSGVPEPTTEPSGPGVFRMQVPFMMRGPWEVRIDLVSPRAGSERVVFDVCVAE